MGKVLIWKIIFQNNWIFLIEWIFKNIVVFRNDHIIFLEIEK